MEINKRLLIAKAKETKAKMENLEHTNDGHWVGLDVQDYGTLLMALDSYLETLEKLSEGMQSNDN